MRKLANDGTFFFWSIVFFVFMLFIIGAVSYTLTSILPINDYLYLNILGRQFPFNFVAGVLVFIFVYIGFRFGQWKFVEG